MDKVFSTMLEIGIYSGVIVLIVLILRLVFHKASKAVICALWFLVGLRLLLFVPIESSFAIMPRLSIKETVREYSESTATILVRKLRWMIYSKKFYFCGDRIVLSPILSLSG